jgi:hypothetical protein
MIGGSAAENATVWHSEGRLDQRRPPQYLVWSKESTTKQCGGAKPWLRDTLERLVLGTQTIA